MPRRPSLPHVRLRLPLPRRLRPLAVAGAVALALTALGAVGPTGEPGTAAAAPGKVKFDPGVKLHPLLQYAAAAEPDKEVAVIVQKAAAAKGKPSRAVAAAAGGPVRVTAEQAFIDSFSATVKAKHLPKLAKSADVRYVTPDAPVRTTAVPDTALKTAYEQTIGATAVWNSPTAPATGKGVTVAVIDSGINAARTDFDPRPGVAGYAGGDVVCIGAAQGMADSCKDQAGHGTHVAGIISGYDAQGRYIGVAPDARIVSVKIGNDERKRKSTETDALDALQWVYTNRAKYNIRAVNLSMTSGYAASYNASPLNAAVEQLWFGGVVVVASSSNRGPVADAVWYAPGNDPFVVTVGALDDNGTPDPADDSLAPFSSLGRTLDGFAKPEIVAPGRRIVSVLASANSNIALDFPERIVDGKYVRMSGTSMSAPVVTGIVALLLERYPTLTPNQVKWLLVSSAKPYANQPDSANLVNVPALFALAAAGTPGSANAGLTPSKGLNPTTGTVTSAQTYWDQTYWDQTYWDQSIDDASADFD